MFESLMSIILKFDVFLCSGLFFFWSSRSEVLCKNDGLKNFAKFTGKHLCRSESLFFKVPDIFYTSWESLSLLSRIAPNPTINHILVILLSLLSIVQIYSHVKVKGSVLDGCKGYNKRLSKINTILNKKINSVQQ